MTDPVGVRQSNLSWQEVDDEIVVLDLESSAYLSLNSAAGFLWKALAAEPRGLGDLATELAAAYKIPPDRAEADVQAFVAQCRERNLLA